MPLDYTLSQLAEADIIGIYRYIADEALNPINAKAVYLRILETLTLLSDYPEVGQYRPDITKHALKVFPVPESHYLVFYDPASKPLFIARILSTHMNLTTLMKGMESKP